MHYKFHSSSSFSAPNKHLESVARRVGHTLQAQHITELISETQEPGKSTCVPESLSHFRENRKTSTYKRRLSEAKAEGW